MRIWIRVDYGVDWAGSTIGCGRLGGGMRDYDAFGRIEGYGRLINKKKEEEGKAGLKV